MYSIFKAFSISLALILTGLCSVVVQPVRADPFYQSGGDSLYCEFAVASSIHYGELPGVGSTVSYDSSQVRGKDLQFFLDNNISAVADVSYPDARRYSGVADYVAVPPLTEVEFAMFGYNYTSHPIEVTDGFLYLSGADPSQPGKDLTRILDTENIEYKDVLYVLMGHDIVRSGYVVRLGHLGVYPPTTMASAPAGKSIFKSRTIQPIQVLTNTVSYEYLEHTVRFERGITLNNASMYTLGGIHVQEGMPGIYAYDETIELAPGETRSLSFEFEVSFIDLEVGDFVLGSLAVHDPNTHIEYSGVGGGTSLTMLPEARNLLLKRTDTGTPSSWTGIQPEFATVSTGQRMGIQLLPYTVHEPPLSVHLDPRVILEKSVKSGVSGAYGDQSLVSVGEDLRYRIRLENTGPALHGVYLEESFPTSYVEMLTLPSDILMELDELGNLVREIDELQFGGFIEFEIKGQLEYGEEGQVISNTIKLIQDGQIIASDSVESVVQATEVGGHVVRQGSDTHEAELAESGWQYIEYVYALTVFAWGYFAIVAKKFSF